MRGAASGTECRVPGCRTSSYATRVYRTILANRLTQVGQLSLQRAQLPGLSQLVLSWTQRLDMTVYFERFRLLVARSTAVWVVLILACSGVSTPPPFLPTEPRYPQSVGQETAVVTRENR